LRRIVGRKDSTAAARRQRVRVPTRALMNNHV